jgi:hypothetical protein
MIPKDQGGGVEGGPLASDFDECRAGCISEEQHLRECHSQDKNRGPLSETPIALPFGNLMDACYPVNLAPDGFSSVGGKPLYDFRIKVLGEL